MIRFSRPRRLFTFGASREDAYSGQGAYFFFEKQPNVKKRTLIFISKQTIFKTVAVTHTDGECAVNVRDLP